MQYLAPSLTAAMAFTMLNACGPASEAVELGPFQDCEACPEMVLVPGGHFTLGSSPSEDGHIADEAPQRAITLQPFAVSRHEITRGEFARFAEAVGHQNDPGCLVMSETGGWIYDPEASWREPGFEQTDAHPVVCLSWATAQAYVRWLNTETGTERYRLLTEAQWEYAARAGSTTAFWWGDDKHQSCRWTNGADAGARAVYPGWLLTADCEDGFIYTAPVGHFNQPNGFGVEDMVGNVWEWVEDCYVDTYATMAEDGSAQQVDGDCERRVMRGGAWGDYGAQYLRSAYRGAWRPDIGFSNLGLRVAKSVDAAD